MTSEMDATRRELDSRLDTVGWGLCFLVSGAVLLVPGLPDGSWLTGIGASLLGLDVVRARLGLPVSAFWVTLWAGLTAWGVGLLVGVALPWFSLLLILCGLALMVGELGRARRFA